MSKFKIGDRCVVTGGSYFNEGDEVTIVGDPDSNMPDCRNDKQYRSLYVYARHLELITTKGGKMTQPKQRRTFRLLKAMPGYKAGTLFQEQCEDGTQPYSVIHEPGYDSFHEVRLEFKNRAYVEDNPKWFAEVFKVTPEFMTREELDQWEAFKGRKKPGRKVMPDVTVNPFEKPRKSKWSPARRKAQSRKLKASWARRKAAQAA